jgi:uncharacterized phage infection (PIP) family protein YhgE
VPQSTSAALSNIFTHVQPIFLGVLAGAVLTLITQLWILPPAAALLADTRRDAVAWFDEAVWPHFRRYEEPASERLLATVQEIVQGLGTAAQQISAVVTQQQGASQGLFESARLVQTAAESFGTSCQQFETRIGHLFENFAQMGRFINDSLAPALRVLDSFRQRLEQLLGPENELRLRAASQTFDATVAGCQRLTASLDNVAQRQEQAGRVLETQATSLRNAGAAVEQMTRTLEASHERLTSSLGTFSSATQRFEGVVEEAVLPAFEEVRQIHTVLATLRATTEGFHNLKELEPCVTGLLAGLAAATSVAQEVAQLPQQIRTALASVREEYNRALEQFGQVGTGVVGRVRAAVDPLTGEVEELNGALGGLRDSADAFRELLDLAPRVQPLLEGLHAAAVATDAAARLPQHIKEALHTLERELPRLAEQMKQTTEAVLEREIQMLPEMLNQTIQHIRGWDDAPRAPAHSGSDGGSRK